MSKEERTSVSAAPQSTMIKWPWWKKFLIGSGEFGENMSNAMFTTYISIFYTDIAGIAPALVTLIVWITKSGTPSMTFWWASWRTGRTQSWAGTVHGLSFPPFPWWSSPSCPS